MIYVTPPPPVSPAGRQSGETVGLDLKVIYVPPPVSPAGRQSGETVGLDLKVIYVPPPVSPAGRQPGETVGLDLKVIYVTPPPVSPAGRQSGETVGLDLKVIYVTPPPVSPAGRQSGETVGLRFKGHGLTWRKLNEQEYVPTGGSLFRWDRLIVCVCVGGVIKWRRYQLNKPERSCPGRKLYKWNYCEIINEGK